MKKRTVLIVDDQIINRKILRKILETDYSLLEAENGQKALEIMQQNAAVISAVLLDIIMPGLDGYQVMEAMAKDAALSKIPVIVSSQRDGEDDEIKALTLGAQDFIAKPYKADIIRHRLGNLIRLRETAAIINLAEKDELTGLYNKQFFIQTVTERLQQNPDRSYDMVCLGIEYFRLINKAFGTARGDDLLRFIAKLLRESESDGTICGHFHADMFYVLRPRGKTPLEDTIRAWDKAIQAYPLDMDIKVHCGACAITDITQPVTGICDCAQMAAEKNKRRYDELFCSYDDSLRQRVVDEQFITGAMRSALEEHQFQVYYQPKYDLNNEYVAGAEALVRWIHPEKGVLSPGLFIPIFERDGFISRLDQYVWETACRDIRSWLDKGYPAVAVSVNVSRSDLFNPKLTDILLNLLKKYRLPIHLLHLEITESAYTANTEQIVSAVKRLRRAGFMIEMDDFGSGYSSLNMLSEMPVNVLKLDMGFVQHETDSLSGRGILSFVISLAKWLDLAVVAEGVETAEQIRVLRSMDCNYVQGFYYAKPMPERDFRRLLETNRTTEMICNSQTAHDLVTAPAAEAARPAQPKSGRVMLIVDDMELNRAVLAGIFEQEYTIMEAENGAAAWSYLENHYAEVEIVMLDLLMPVVDGYQLLNRIRTDARTQELPVIITSQEAGNGAQRALSLEANDFISKPYDPDVIRHRVKNVMAAYVLHHEGAENAPAAVPDAVAEMLPAVLSQDQKILQTVDALKSHFQIVRLVDAEKAQVFTPEAASDCVRHSCFSVWGKAGRCNNCTSLKALHDHTRCSKLEYSRDGLYYVISEYVPYGKDGAVMEMVSRLEDEYVDNILDKDLLYMNLDAINQQLDEDAMTGVYNRRHISRHLNSYLENARKRSSDVGLAMVDVDNFKHFNDSYGHLVGDEIIKAVAQILQQNIARSKGDFVARFGGDEFLVVCRGIPADVFARRMASVAEQVKKLTEDEKICVPVTISAGCVNLSEIPDCTENDIIRRADQRLYKAKAAGGSTVVNHD